MLPPLWFRYLQLPPASVYSSKQTEYAQGHATYASYNYLRGGLVARVKASHFEAALRLTRHRFGTTSAIDFGCADGVFLPSLGRWFVNAVGIDRDREAIEIADNAMRSLRLENVRLICSDGMDVSALAENLAPDSFSVLYTIMTLEHFGERGRAYESRADLVDMMFDLLEPNGIVLVGVPNMVGLPFLIQRIVLSASRLHRDPITSAQMFKAIVRKDTTELEPHWHPETHLGFNHVKLLDFLRQRAYVLGHRSLLFEEMFLLSRQRT
jgi:SAM-dependent methyltransferase